MILNEKKGVAACALSHLRVWEAFLFTGDEYWIVSEDDVEVLECIRKFEYAHLPKGSLTWLYHRCVPQGVNEKLVPMRTPTWFDQGSTMYGLDRSGAVFLKDTVYWHRFFSCRELGDDRQLPTYAIFLILSRLWKIEP